MKLVKRPICLSFLFFLLLAVFVTAAAQAQVDLNGEDRSINNLSNANHPIGFINSDGAGGAIGNATLTITNPNELNAYNGVFGQSDGQFSNIKLILDTKANVYTFFTPTAKEIVDGEEVTVNVPNYHTLGTEILSGIFCIQAESALGPGSLKIDGGALAFGQYYGNSSFNRNIEIGPGNAVLRKGWNGDMVTINGLIHGEGSLYIARDNGTFLLTKQNTYQGNTIVGFDGTYAYSGGSVQLRLGIDNALPVTTNLEVRGSGNVEMNGYSQTVKSLIGNSEIRNTTDHLVDGVATSLPSTLTVSDSNNFDGTPGSFNGRIYGNNGSRFLTVVKESGGTLTFGGSTGNFDNSRLEINEGIVEARKTGGNFFSQVWLNPDKDTFLKIGAGNQQIGDLGGYGTISSTGDIPDGQIARLTITGDFNGFTGSFGVDGGSQNDFQLVIGGGGRDLRENATNPTDMRSARPSYHTGGTVVEASDMVTISSFNLFGSDLTLRNSAIIGIWGLLNGTSGAENAYLTYGSETDQTPIKLEGEGGGFRMRGASTLNIAKPITGSGDFMLAADGNARLTLSSPDNDYTGRTIIGTPWRSWSSNSERAILALAPEGRLPEGTELVFGQQRNDNNPADHPYMLEIAGHDVVLSKITGGKGRISNVGGTQASVSLNSDTDWYMTNVQFAGDILLKKTGQGTALIHPSMYSASGVEISAGKFVANTDAAAPAGETIHVTGDSGLAADTFQNWGRVFVPGGNPNNSAFRGAAPAPDAYVRGMSDVADTAYAEKQSYNSGLWRNDSTYIYTLELEITETTPIQFFKNFDDWALITMTPSDGSGNPNGTPVVFIDNGNHNFYIISEAEEFAPGTYLLEVRLGQGGGGTGKTSTAVDQGIGIYIGGDIDPVLPTAANAITADMNKFSALTIDDNGNLGIAGGPIKALTEKRTVATNFDIDGGSTFTISGNGTGGVDFTGEFSGSGTMAVDGTGAPVTLSGKYFTASDADGNTTFKGKVTVADGATFGNPDKVSLSGDTSLTFDGSATKLDLDLAGNAIRISGAVALGHVGHIFTSEEGGTLTFLLDHDNPGNSQIFADSIDLQDLEFVFDVVDFSKITFDDVFPLLALNYYYGEDLLDPADPLLMEQYFLQSFGYPTGGGLWNYTLEDGLLKISLNDQAVPEPATWGLFLFALLGTAAVWRRR